MNWKRIFSSPPPAAVWVLDRDLVGIVRRGANGQLESRSVRLDEPFAEVGPVGLQGLDAGRLSQAMARALDGVATVKRAAVIVPTSWVRCYLLDFDHLPRRSAEITDVLRWRLKKLLPVAAADLRLAWILSTRDGDKRMLCQAALEKSMTALEAAFTAAGVSPGLISPCLFALAADVGAGAGQRLVVQQERDFLSMLLIKNGTPELIRTKPTAVAADGAVDQSDQRLVHTYIRESLGFTGPIRVSVAAESATASEQLREWWAACPEITVDPPVAQDTLSPGAAEEIGPARLAAAASVLEGGGP